MESRAVSAEPISQRGGETTPGGPAPYSSAWVEGGAAGGTRYPGLTDCREGNLSLI